LVSKKPEENPIRRGKGSQFSQIYKEEEEKVY